MKRLPGGTIVIGKTLDGNLIRERRLVSSERMKESGYVHGTWKYRRNRKSGSPYFRGWVKVVKSFRVERNNANTLGEVSP